MRNFLIGTGVLLTIIAVVIAAYVLPWGETIIAGSVEHALDQLVIMQVRTMWLIAGGTLFIGGLGLLIAGLRQPRSDV